jgi:hypothetical protein
MVLAKKNIIRTLPLRKHTLQKSLAKAQAQEKPTEAIQTKLTAVSEFLTKKKKNHVISDEEVQDLVLVLGK